MIEKEKVEKAIENINGLILDFGEAVDSLRETREFLYSLIEEKEPEDENG